ncbi:AAA ATPase [Bacillus phage vB_BpuM-BpSp]|nr:AAA ATPase [Bacillus phage vB_BpuM-BpSp]
MKMSGLLKAIQIAVESGSVPMVMGHAGIGKSTVAKLLAKVLEEKHDREVEYVEVYGSVLKEGELTGMPINTVETYNGREMNVTTYTVHTAVKKLWEASDAGKIPLLFLDEINRSDIAVQQELMQVLLTKEINGNPLPEETIMVAAGNPDSEDDEGLDYQVNTMNYALRDRFTELTLEADPDEWIKWGLQSVEMEINGKNQSTTMIHKDIIEYITNHPTNLIIVNADQQEKNPTPRSWERTSDALRYFESEMNLNNEDDQKALLAVIQGNIGSNIASDFISFKLNNDQPMIDPARIIDNKDLGKDEKLLKEIEEETMMRLNLLSRYVYMYIAKNYNNFNDKKLDNYITFLSLIPSDLLMGTISDIKKDKSEDVRKIFSEKLVTSDEFIKFAGEIINSAQN